MPGQTLLAAGTTAGVAVLSLCLFIPLRRLRLRLRPGLRFSGAARKAVGGLAAAGAVIVGTQQVAVLVAVWLCFAWNAPGGSMVLFTLAQTVFLLPWSVLAVPLATAAYPTLAAAHSRGDSDGYRATLAPAARGVILLACLGAAVLVAVCVPAAAFLVPPGQAAALAAGIAGFAPGLVGYGLFAIGSRALYAAGRPGPAAGAVAAGWCAVVVAAPLLATLLPAHDRVLALALANAVGMSAMGVLLVLALRRTGGGAATLSGLGRATAVGVLAGLVAAAAGSGAVALAGGFASTPTVSGAVLQGMLSGATTLVVFLAVCLPLDRHDLRPMVAATIRRTRGLAAGARPGGKGTVSQ